MSDTSKIGFVRHDQIPPSPPPVSEAGVFKWMRENLFSNFVNAILTILAVVFVIWAVYSALPWIWNGVWITSSLKECRNYLGDTPGACWSVITERWNQLLFGFQYPVEAYWRPALAFVLLFISAAPVLFSKLPRWGLVATALYPFLAYWLIWGGAFWEPILILAGIVLTVLVFKAVLARTSDGPALFAAAVVFLLWFIFGQGMISGGIDRMMSAARMDSKTAELQVQVAELPDTIAVLEAQANEIRGGVAAELDAALATEDQATIRAAYHNVADRRAVLRDLGQQMGVLKARLSKAGNLLTRAENLPQLEAELPNLVEQAAQLRAALPESVEGVDNEGALSSLRARNVSDELGISDADLLLADAVVALESRIKTSQLVVDRTHADIARVGFEPVASRDMGGFMLNMILGTICVALSIPLGIVLALGRQSNLPIVKGICVVFIEFVRGVPLITLLFVANVVLAFFFPPGTNMDLILRVIIMITMFSSAYIAEVIRGGLAALPRGQYEAGDSLGLDYAQSMRLIILPQALKISIPGIVNVAVGLFKDTTLVSVISMFDLVGMIRGPVLSSTAWTGIYWEAFIFASILFFIVCYGISQYSQWLERQLRTDHH